MSSPLSAVVDDYGKDRQVAQLRIPPHSIEAESSVLGGLLLDNLAWDGVSDLLHDGDFYRYEHRLVFAAMASLITASRPADVITVFEHLQSLGKAEEIREQFLAHDIELVLVNHERYLGKGKRK